jgi:hypothetical protein
LRDSTYTKKIVHLSQTQEDEHFDNVFNDLADELRNASSGHISDIFSASISNADFDVENNSSSRLARECLKQLWEESSSVADNLGTVGVKELERHLVLFRKFCNEATTDAVGRNIPMTQGKYSGKVKRIKNTHHM